MSYFSLLKTHYAKHKVPLKLSIACLFNYFRVINTLHSLRINFLSTTNADVIADADAHGHVIADAHAHVIADAHGYVRQV